MITKQDVKNIVGLSRLNIMVIGTNESKVDTCKHEDGKYGFIIYHFERGNFRPDVSTNKGICDTEAQAKTYGQKIVDSCVKIMTTENGMAQLETLAKEMENGKPDKA